MKQSFFLQSGVLLGLSLTLTAGVFTAPFAEAAPAGASEEVECLICKALTASLSEFAAIKASQTAPRGSKERRDLELQEAAVLQAVAKKISAFLLEKGSLDAESRPVEFEALTTFLAVTADRDGTTIVLENVTGDLGVSRTKTFLKKVEKHLAKLDAEKKVSHPQSAELRSAIEAVTGEDQG